MWESMSDSRAISSEYCDCDGRQQRVTELGGRANRARGGAARPFQLPQVAAPLPRSRFSPPRPAWTRQWPRASSQPRHGRGRTNPRACCCAVGDGAPKSVSCVDGIGGAGRGAVGGRALRRDRHTPSAPRELCTSELWPAQLLAEQPRMAAELSPARQVRIRVGRGGPRVGRNPAAAGPNPRSYTHLTHPLAPESPDGPRVGLRWGLQVGSEPGRDEG